jgi:hypothetical protein
MSAQSDAAQKAEAQPEKIWAAVFTLEAWFAIGFRDRIACVCKKSRKCTVSSTTLWCGENVWDEGNEDDTWRLPTPQDPPGWRGVPIFETGETKVKISFQCPSKAMAKAIGWSAFTCNGFYFGEDHFKDDPDHEHDEFDVWPEEFDQFFHQLKVGEYGMKFRFGKNLCFKGAELQDVAEKITVLGKDITFPYDEGADYADLYSELRDYIDPNKEDSSEDEISVTDEYASSSEDDEKPQLAEQPPLVDRPPLDELADRPPLDGQPPLKRRRDE